MGLEGGGDSPGRLNPKLIRDYWAVLTANHLIFAAQPQAGQLKAPSTPEIATQLTTAKWGVWISKPQELEMSSGDGSTWDIRDLAHRARQKMSDAASQDGEQL